MSNGFEDEELDLFMDRAQDAEETVVHQILISTKNKTMSIGKRKYKLLMCYLCPFDKKPVIMYWKTDGKKKVTDKEIQLGINYRGIKYYRYFQTKNGQGIEYNSQEDNTLHKHTHQKKIMQQRSWGSYETTQVYDYEYHGILNITENMNKLLHDLLNLQTFDSDVEMDTKHEIVTEKGALEILKKVNTEDKLEWRVMEDICNHGKPIFWFSKDLAFNLQDNYISGSKLRILALKYFSNLTKLNVPQAFIQKMGEEEQRMEREGEDYY